MGGKKDATSMLTSLLQAPPSTPEDMKKVHGLLDRLEAKLKKQLADHSTKARLIELQKQKEEASVKFAMLEQQAAHALTKCASGANSLRMEVARIQKQSKQSLADMKGSLATCLYEKKALGKQQQFRTFKSYVYGKLQELVKTSTIAVERERTVTSTVRKENTDLRMRLEAAYETSKRGMLLRDLTTKNQWCQEQLAQALHPNATSA